MLKTDIGFSTFQAVRRSMQSISNPNTDVYEIHHVKKRHRTHASCPFKLAQAKDE